MKILFITSSSINGGAQKHIRDMFLDLHKKGHQVFLAAPIGWLTEELSTYNHFIFRFVSIKKTWKTIRLLIRDIHPDITNTFILSGAYYGYCAWKKERIGKLFITVNNPVIYDGISPMNRLLYPFVYRMLSKHVNAFLVKSDVVKNEVSTVIKNKKPVISIKNGIDFDKFDKEKKYVCDLPISVKDSGTIITNVGALEDRKGQIELIDAVQTIKNDYPVQLLIVGEGSNRNKLEKLIQEKNLGSFVHLLGTRKDINSILSVTDIFVLPSHHEGLPNALMEAMAMGLPCIATDVGGVRQLIVNKDFGIVVSPKSVSDLINAIRLFIENRDYAQSCGSNAFNKILSEYKQDVVVNELVSIYERF